MGGGGGFLRAIFARLDEVLKRHRAALLEPSQMVEFVLGDEALREEFLDYFERELVLLKIAPEVVAPWKHCGEFLRRAM